MKASAAFEQNGNFLGMARMLEQAAKEVGGSFTNQRQHTGKDGGAIKYEDVTQMTDEQLDAELRQLGIDPDTARIAPPTKH